MNSNTKPKNKKLFGRLPPQRQVFLLAAGLACVVFLPFLIYDRGYFFFFGDFNVQQIPFYQLAHQAVRGGNFSWNWYTDLGVNFVGAYSFYLIFSPFFWLTLPFPTSFVPYLMAPLLVLKIACAATTAYHYIKRFVRDPAYAVIGGIMYAFSGFSVYNIFFNHFHEMIVLFPLLLIALEELMLNNRRGWFALAVAVNCIVNYWFFIGEVVFVIIYVFVRMGGHDWRMSAKKFILIAFEAVLGLALATFALLPSLMAIAGNPRTTTDNLLTGFNFWIYWDTQRFPAILQSIFFPPDLPSRPNFFPNHGAKWASMTAWLPLFSTVGVIAYQAGAKHSWLKRMLWLSLALALTPGTNSIFILFNHSYYARWFYMPVLLMCLATVIALEDKKFDLKRGLRWTGGIILGFTLAIALTPIRKDGEIHLGLMAEPPRFWLSVGTAALCLGLTFWLVMVVGRDHPKFKRYTAICLAAISVFHGISFIFNGKLHSNDPVWMRDVALYGRENIDLPDGPFARVDIHDSMDNLGMYWHLPNIQAFHSVVPNSIMEFYPAVGVKRDVSSKPETRLFALRPLLSVRWLFVKDDYHSPTELMPGYSYYGSQLGYNIYENDNYLPMGFGYDMAFSDDILNMAPKDLRSNLMLQGVHLDAEDLATHSDILELIEYPSYEMMDAGGMEDTVAERAAMGCDTFEIDTGGFTATSSLGQDTIMFFSVPYERGWAAQVNGDHVDIMRANIGFMAVRVPAGDAVIRFSYTTPGLKTGAMVSLGALAVLGIYMFYAKRKIIVGAVALSPTENADSPEQLEQLRWPPLGERSGPDEFLHGIWPPEEGGWGGPPPGTGSADDSDGEGWR